MPTASGWFLGLKLSSWMLATQDFKRLNIVSNRYYLILQPLPPAKERPS